MSQNPFFRSSDSQTFMSHSLIPALIHDLKVLSSGRNINGVCGDIP